MPLQYQGWFHRGLLAWGGGGETWGLGASLFLVRKILRICPHQILGGGGNPVFRSLCNSEIVIGGEGGIMPPCSYSTVRCGLEAYVCVV